MFVRFFGTTARQGAQKFSAGVSGGWYYPANRLDVSLFHKPIQKLATNIRVFSDKFDTKSLLEKLNTLYSCEDLKPLFDVAMDPMSKVQGSHLKFYFHRNYLIGGVPVCGSYNFLNNTIHVSTEPLLHQSEITGTILHELSHYVEEQLNQNQCLPYKAGASSYAISKAAYRTMLNLSKNLSVKVDDSLTSYDIGRCLVQKYNFRSCKLPGEDGVVLSKMLSIYQDYHKNEEHVEIVVKYAQLLATEISQPTLEKYLNPLIRYHRQVTLPKVEYFLARQSSRAHSELVNAIRKYIGIESCLLRKIEEDKCHLIFTKKLTSEKKKEIIDVLVQAGLDVRIEKKPTQQGGLFQSHEKWCIHHPINVIATRIASAVTMREADFRLT